MNDTLFLSNKISIYVKMLRDSGSSPQLGLSLKNLGCIKYDKKNRWIGQTGNIKGFCVFKDYSFGLRALVMIICRYVFSYKYKDLWSVINRYAPVEDNNNVGNYYKRVVDICGFDSLVDDIDILKEQIALIVFSIVSVEIGKLFSSYIKTNCLNLFNKVVIKYVDEYLEQVIYPVYGKITNVTDIKEF